MMHGQTKIKFTVLVFTNLFEISRPTDQLLLV